MKKSFRVELTDPTNNTNHTRVLTGYTLEAATAEANLLFGTENVSSVTLIDAPFMNLKTQQRKVLFKRWVAQRWVDEHGKEAASRGNTNNKPVPGTGCYEAEFKNPGLFQGWGNEVHEGDNGLVMETIAIIENKFGGIEHIVPKNIQFVEPVANDIQRVMFNTRAFNEFFNRPIKKFTPDNFIVHRIFINKAPIDFAGDGITFTDVCRVAFGEDGNYDAESLSCHYSHDSEKEGVVKTAGIMRFGDKLPVIEGMTFDFNYTVAGLEIIAKNQTEQP